MVKERNYPEVATNDAQLFPKFSILLVAFRYFVPIARLKVSMLKSNNIIIQQGLSKSSRVAWYRIECSDGEATLEIAGEALLYC